MTRRSEDEPAASVLARLHGNQPAAPTPRDDQPPDPTYARRKEAWDLAVEREQRRSELEAEGKSPKEAGEHHAREVQEGKHRGVVIGAKADGPTVTEMAEAAEKRERERALQETQEAGKQARRRRTQKAKLRPRHRGYIKGKKKR